MKILVPNTISLDDLTVAAGDTTMVYDATAPFPPETFDAEVLVAWRNTAANLTAAATDLQCLRLVQTLAAGPDMVLAAGFGSAVTIVSGRSLHDATVAEHTLALTLALIRRLDRLRDAQRDALWDEEFLEAQRSPLTESLYTLAGASVCIWGFGSIAQRVAPMFEMLGAQVSGVASSAGIRNGYKVIVEKDLALHLANVDVLISLLPAIPSTRKAFGSELLDALKPGAIFINVGRGSTVDESALVAALYSGQLRAAALDVMETEPLPANSPLWATPNLLLTPHAAGNRPRGAAALITHNISALNGDATFVNLIDRTQTVT